MSSLWTRGRQDLIKGTRRFLPSMNRFGNGVDTTWSAKEANKPCPFHCKVMFYVHCNLTVRHCKTLRSIWPKIWLEENLFTLLGHVMTVIRLHLNQIGSQFDRKCWFSSFETQVFLECIRTKQFLPGWIVLLTKRFSPGWIVPVLFVGYSLLQLNCGSAILYLRNTISL